MSWFHRHHWVEASRTFSGPHGGHVKITGDPPAFERAIHGFTTVVLRCSGCGDLSSKVFLGRISDA